MQLSQLSNTCTATAGVKVRKFARNKCQVVFLHAHKGGDSTNTTKDEIDRAETECHLEEDLYPDFETNSNDLNFLPRRQPGGFPDVKKENTRQGPCIKIDQKLPTNPGPASSVANEEFDPLRDGPLRYLGYANECGEAFAAWLPFWGVPASYAVAIGYVLMDTADKGTKAYTLSCNELSANKELDPEVRLARQQLLHPIPTVLDFTLIMGFHVEIMNNTVDRYSDKVHAGFTIHTIVAVVHTALLPIEATSTARNLIGGAAAILHLPSTEVTNLVDKSLPTALGLAAIPFIVHPIDNAIHAAMNISVRPAMRRYICGQGQGQLAGLQMCAEKHCGQIKHVDD